MGAKGNPVWYAMYVTYGRELKVKEMLDKESVLSFIPMHYVVKGKYGKKRKELVPVIHNFIFIYTTDAIMRRLKSEIPFLQYVMNRRAGEKIIVPDEQMRVFIAVTGSYDDRLLYLKTDELNLSKGTRVRVTGGEFEGYEGIFLKVKGARDRRVVIAIEGVIAVAMASIPQELIEVVQESDIKSMK